MLVRVAAKLNDLDPEANIAAVIDQGRAIREWRQKLFMAYSERRNSTPRNRPNV